MNQRPRVAWAGASGPRVARAGVLGPRVARAGMLLAFLSHRIICKRTNANCNPSPRSIPGYRIHREIVTLSYLYNRTRINVASITRLSRGYVMGR
jgi:hypothetical protein